MLETFQMVETILVPIRGVTTHQTIPQVATRIRALVMASTAVQTPIHISWYVGSVKSHPLQSLTYLSMAV